MNGAARRRAMVRWTVLVLFLLLAAVGPWALSANAADIPWEQRMVSFGPTPAVVRAWLGRHLKPPHLAALARFHPDPVGDPVAGMEDNRLAGAQARDHFRLEEIPLADFDGLQARDTVPIDEHGPLVPVPE